MNAIGIFAGGTGDSITNSGTISAQGTNSRAIDFQGNQSILTLLPGSSMQGVINYTSGAAASGTLNIEGGVGASLTFTGAVPAKVHANGLIVGVDQSALKVVAADASSAKVSGLDVDALLDSVFSSLNNRATGDSAPLDPLGYSAERRGPEAFAFLDESQSLAQPSAWLKLFGGVSKLELPTGVQASSQMGGLIAGIEMPLTQLDTAGFFLGGATGSTLAGSADITQNSGFAGFYSEHHFDQYALDMALVLGGTHYSGVRSVIDNTLPGGVTTANADYNGFFVSPELGLTRDFDLGGKPWKCGVAFNMQACSSRGIVKPVQAAA